MPIPTLDPQNAVRNLKVSPSGIVTFDLPTNGAPHGVAIVMRNDQKINSVRAEVLPVGTVKFDLNIMEMNTASPFWNGDKLLVWAETLGPVTANGQTVIGEETHQIAATLELAMNCSNAYLRKRVKELDARTADLKQFAPKEVGDLLLALADFKKLLVSNNLNLTSLPGLFVTMNTLVADFDKRVEKIVATQVAAAISKLPPVLPPNNGQPGVAPAPGNQPHGCSFWKWFCKFGPCALLAAILLVLVCCLMHFASSQNVNALNIGWNNKIDVRYQTTVTNIIVPAPEPSECQRAREERKIEALTEATRALERRERNEFLLDQKRRKEQETAEIPQTEQAQPTRNLNIQGSDAGYYSNGNYSQPIYIDQDRRDYNAGISAAINAGVEFNVGFGNNGACYPAVVHFVPVQRGCGRPIVRWHN